MRARLAHFADLVGSWIEMDRPRLRLSAAAAQSIGMAVHELATNAGKYGALSVDAGRVDGENVIMRCRSGSLPEVGSGGALLLARQEGLDDAHVTAATWAGMLWRFQLFGRGGGLDGIDRDEPHREQGADTSDAVGTCWAGQQALVTDAVEALGQHMHQEAADELMGIERHHLVSLPTFQAVIFPFEGDAFVIERDEAPV